MSDPASTGPDLFSIPAAEQAELAAAIGRLLSADSYPPAGDNPLAPLTRDVTRIPIDTAPGSGLHTFGYLDRQRRTAGTHLGTSHRGQRTEAG